jgi:hypothetical protein
MSEYTDPAQPPRRDDLQKITGIDPVLAKRLEEAGITSYRDLATVPAERIAELLGGASGVSAERITSQDWVGQAQRLAEDETGNPRDNQRYATFHVDLLIDSDGGVRRTKVLHYQTDREDTWAGWDQKQLIAVITDRAGSAAIESTLDRSAARAGLTEADVLLPTGGPRTSRKQPTRPETAPSCQPSPLPPHIHVDGPHLTGAGPHRNFRREGQPFQVLVTIRAETADATRPDDLDITVEVESRPVDSGTRHLLGIARKIIGVDRPSELELTALPLPPGLHALHAVITVYRHNHEAGDEPLYRHRNPGELVHVACQTLQDQATH